MRGINLEIEKNEMIGIIGQVGSGKTSFLMSILKETPYLKADTLSINGSVFYVSQEPWIFSGTIRQNILFGKEFNKQQFTKVIQCCCLDEVSYE